MPFDKKQPDFYDETLVNQTEFAIARDIKTKVFSRRESLDTAKPDEDTTASDARPWRVSFIIETSRVELIFEVNGKINIGRSARDDQPLDGIDLSPFNGHELGVSRFHAEISLKNEQITIIDKGSANGTLLNQQKLEPGISYRVRHGDNISFGNMPIHIHFLTPVFQGV